MSEEKNLRGLNRRIENGSNDMKSRNVMVEKEKDERQKEGSEENKKKHGWLVCTFFRKNESRLIEHFSTPSLTFLLCLIQNLKLIEVR